MLGPWNIVVITDITLIFNSSNIWLFESEKLVSLLCVQLKSLMILQIATSFAEKYLKIYDIYTVFNAQSIAKNKNVLKEFIKNLWLNFRISVYWIKYESTVIICVATRSSHYVFVALCSTRELEPEEAEVNMLRKTQPE